MSFYSEYPHTRNYDDDLRELIRLYKDLGKEYETLVQIYELIKQNIKDITIEQLQQWLDDGTLENVLNTALFNGKISKVDTAELLMQNSNFANGIVVQTLGYHSINDGGHGMYLIKTQGETTANGCTILQLPNSLVAELIIPFEINVKALGAYGDGLHDDTSALLFAFANVKNTGSIYFPNGTYLTSEALIIKGQKIGISIYSESRSTIKFTNDTHGLVLGSDNENYGRHIVKNLIIQGINNYFAGTNTYTSTKNGIDLTKGFYCAFENVIVKGFQHGVHIDGSNYNAIHNTFYGNCEIIENEIGVYITGNAANINQFNNVRIRHNWKRGVIVVATSAPFPTSNMFINCYIESNIPYPYPQDHTTGNNDSVGILIFGSYQTIIQNCYFENQYFATIINGSSDGTLIENCFIVVGTGNGLNKISLQGEGTNGNIINNVYFTNGGIIELDGSVQNYNQIRNSKGFTLSGINNNNRPDIINSGKNVYNNGLSNNALTLIKSSMVATFSGSSVGGITGMGTAKASVNLQSVSELQIGSLLTADTTLTNFTGMVPGQLCILYNYQESHTITIPNGNGISGPITPSGADIKLNKYGQSVLLYYTSLNKVVILAANL